MNMKPLVYECRQMIHEMQHEIEHEDRGDAIELLTGILKRFQELDRQIDFINDDDEETLEQIISEIGAIDIDALRHTKEIVILLDSLQGLISQIKTQLLTHQNGDIKKLLFGMKATFEAICDKL